MMMMMMMMMVLVILMVMVLVILGGYYLLLYCVCHCCSSTFPTERACTTPFRISQSLKVGRWVSSWLVSCCWEDCDSSNTGGDCLKTSELVVWTTYTFPWTHGIWVSKHFFLISPDLLFYQYSYIDLSVLGFRIWNLSRFEVHFWPRNLSERLQVPLFRIKKRYGDTAEEANGRVIELNLQEWYGHTFRIGWIILFFLVGFLTELYC